MKIPVKMCSNQYTYTKLPVDKDDLDSFSDDNLNTTDFPKSDCHGETRSKKLRRFISKGANKLSQFMLNCIQPSSDEYLEYLVPDPYTYYILAGLTYW